MSVVSNLASPVSASVMVRLPESVRVGLLASSVTAPMSVPPMTAGSLTGVTVMSRVVLEPVSVV
ncbi:hypothetical protein D3C84_1316880 [compost metagenome]